MELGLRLAREHADVVRALVVGNEVLLRRELSEADLTQHLARARREAPVPVTYADVWEFWLAHPRVAESVSFVTVHILPYWEDEPVGVERALAHVAHCEAIVVDCDIDVIDRAQFPAAPGARPGGMAATDFFKAVRYLASDPRVRVVDLTEWDPPLDPTDLSALTAARWVAECLAGYESR